MNISDDAVWAAINAFSHEPVTSEEMRATLEAAAPHLMRTAWDEGWEAHGDWGGPTPNPYAKATP